MVPLPITLQQIAIVMPVYNDWAAVQKLLTGIDAALASIPCHARVLMVDDASTEEPDTSGWQELPHVDDAWILHLRRNLGHQRAIAMGLVHVHQNWPGVDAVVVMDSDGEDQPQDIPALLGYFISEGGRKVVFAARSKRILTFFSA